MFIHPDRPLINGDVFRREPHGLPPGRNPHGAVVVARPARIGIQRIKAIGDGAQIVAGDTVHDVRTSLQPLVSHAGERHRARFFQREQVLPADAQFAHQCFGNRLLQAHGIIILHIVRLLVRLPVEIHHAVFQLQRLPGQPHAPLHVVFTTVHRPPHHLAEHLRILVDVFAPHGIKPGQEVTLLLARERIQQRESAIELHVLLSPDAVGHGIKIHVLVGRVGHDRVARRIVEHHDVVQLHPSAADTLIFPLRPLYVGLAPHHRHRVLRERHRKRCHRLARPVAHLTHEQVVAHQERLLQRRRWNGIVLEKIDVHEIDGHEGEHDGVHPAHHRARHGIVRLLPPRPGNAFRDVGIEYERHGNQPPPASNP